MIRSYQGKTPQLARGVWVDPAATIIGDVALGEDASIWPGAVLRGDVHFIHVGRRTNIQDNSVLHGMKDQFPVILGDGVTVGHGVLLHGCAVESRCLIGMGSIILNGARIGEGSIVAAGTLILEGIAIPPGSLVMGHPGKVRRTLSAEDQAGIDAYAARYLEYKKMHQAAG